MTHRQWICPPTEKKEGWDFVKKVESIYLIESQILSYPAMDQGFIKQCG